MDERRRGVDDIDLDVLEREALSAYAPPPPPSDLVDRIVEAASGDGREARGGSEPERRRGWIVVAAVAAAVAVAAAWLLWPHPAAEVLRGEVVAEAPRTLQLGAGAEALLEAGAALRYEVAANGEVVVEQRGGEVLYRVRPGAPFVVETPAGRVRVVGTEFRVEVSTMDASRLEKALAGGTAVAVVTVAVYAGSVLFDNDHGQVALAAGDVASAAAGSAPRLIGPRTEPAPTEPPAKRVSRFESPAAREAFVKALEQARERRRQLAPEPDRPAPSLPPAEGTSPAPASAADASQDREYVRSAMREIVPLLMECYEASLEATPDVGGRVLVRFHLEWEEDVGGVVTESEVEMPAEHGWNDDFRECIAETVMTLRLPEAPSSNEISVTYPLIFSPSEDETDAEHGE